MLRQYYLRPSPAAVATLLREFEAGMPVRRAADPAGTLVFMGTSLFSDPATRVIEWWRYPSAAAAHEGERAAAAAPGWAARHMAAMSVVEKASASLLHACKFSPWQ